MGTATVAELGIGEPEQVVQKGRGGWTAARGSRVLVDEELERIVQPFASDADLARRAHVPGERGAQLRDGEAASERIDQLVSARREIAQAGIVFLSPPAGAIRGRT